MKKSEIKDQPIYFDRYIRLVEDIDLDDAFKNSLNDIDSFNSEILQSIGIRSYKKGKWTVHEIIQHIIDIERILSIGTLHVVRNNNTRMIKFNEEELVKNSNANLRDVNDLLSELNIVRQSTRALYNSFNKNDLFKIGVYWEHKISILAMGFNIIGHQIHHFKFIEDHYFPLV